MFTAAGLGLERGLGGRFRAWGLKLSQCFRVSGVEFRV